jgi:excisionase family DNA binding protein
MSDRKKLHLESKSHAPSKSLNAQRVDPAKELQSETSALETQRALPSQAKRAPETAGISIDERPATTKLLTLKEAADRLAISLPTIRSWVWHRKIEIVKIGRCVRIREQVILDLIATNTVRPGPAH